MESKCSFLYMSLLVCFSMVCFTGSAWASELMQPQTPFKAEMTFQSGESMQMEGHLWYDQGLERREISLMGQNMTLITRPDQGTVFSLYPDQKIALQIELTPEMRYFNNEWVDQFKREDLGHETVSSETTTKYRIDSTDMEGYMWITGDGIIMKMEGRTRTGEEWNDWSLILENLQRGPIDPALLEVPSDFQVMTQSEFLQMKMN